VAVLIPNKNNVSLVFRIPQGVPEPWWGQVIPKHTVSSLSKAREGKRYEDKIDYV